MGDQHDGRTSGAYRLDGLPHVTASQGVEALGELVEEHHPGPVQQRQGDEHPLLEPAREVPERAAPVLGEPPRLEQLWARDGAGSGEQVDGFADPQPLGQRGALQLAPHQAGQVPPVPGVVAEHPDEACVGAPEPLHALDGGGLAGAVAAQDPEDLPCRHVEGDVVDRDQLAVGLAQPPDLDRRHQFIHR